MQCTSPRPVGFQTDGKTIAWSPKKRSKEYASFQLPCGKCLACRLEYARSWAVRCVHESKMHEENSFITLTYSDDHVGNNKLDYQDFQKFMKRLRRAYPNKTIGFNAVGEYGEKTKRQHWHAILFGYYPPDATFSRSNERGDKLFTSQSLDKIWGKGNTETGSVTFHSAGYVSRYNAKKLVHGLDQNHDLHPIAKKSNKHAIGKAWLEQFYESVFLRGSIVLDDGTETTIPRYYEKWLKEHKPTEWLTYVTQVKIQKSSRASARATADLQKYSERRIKRSQSGNFLPETTQNEAKKEILKSRFETLQKNLKL